MKLTNAIFDFDGTLFDSMFLWDTLGDQFLLGLGKAPRPGLRDDLRVLSIYQSARYLQREYDVALSVEEIVAGVNRLVEGFYVHEVQPKPGIPAFLEELRQSGVRMTIATASERAHVEAALCRCGLDSFFEGIFTCTEVGQGKDSPAIFRGCLESLGGDRKNTLLFEDSLHAIKTAKADAFLVVGVRDDSEPRQEELKTLCDGYLADFLHRSDFWKAVSVL